MASQPPTVRRRRTSAVIHRRRPASTVPDVLVGFASVGFTMAALFLFASFFDSDLTDREAGPELAQMFAAALATCATFVFVMALGLLRDERTDISHYLTPGIIGFLIGLAVTVLFLRSAGAWIFVPFPLLIFSARPLRRTVARMLGRNVSTAVMP